MARHRQHGPAAKAITALIIGLFLISACSGDDTGGKKDTKESVDFTIIFSSDLLGKIRSCGCSVKDMGGVGRRATYIERVRESVDNLFVLDAGDAFSLELSYSQAEAELTFDAFSLMELTAFTPGEIEFIFGLDYLRRLAEGAGFDILSANIVEPSSGEPLFGPAFKTVELEGGITVGITGVLDENMAFPSYIDRSGFTVRPAVEALREIVPALEKEADFLILLSHLGLERSKALATEVPNFDVIIVGHGKPITKKAVQVGDTYILATGGMGQYVGRADLTLHRDGGYEIEKMRLIPVVDEIELHEGVVELFEHYGLLLTDKEAKQK